MPQTRCCVLAGLILLVMPLWAQTNSVQDQLNATYRGKVLILRNSYWGNELSFDENGIVQGAHSSVPWTLANIEIKSIALTAQGLEISGERMGVLYKDSKPSYEKLGKLKIQVAKPTSGTTTEKAFSEMLGKIFVVHAEDLRGLVPDYWKPYFSGPDAQSRSAAWEASLREQGIAPLKPKDYPNGQLKPPQPIQTPDPRYTKEAASRHIEGSSILRTVIDQAGTPTQTVIVRPLGMGLDERAVAALARWRFKPAVLDGNAVPVEINVQIDFRCCP